MTIGVIYWMLLIIWFVFGLWTGGWAVPAASSPTNRLVGWGGNLLLLVLFVLIGLKVFGSPIRD